MGDDHATQSSNGRIDEITTFDNRPSERSSSSVHTAETQDVERKWSTSAASGRPIDVENESTNQNAYGITTDTFRTSQDPSSVPLSETQEHSELQSVLPSQPQRNDTVEESTVSHDDSVSVSEVTSLLVTVDGINRGGTLVNESVFRESTAGAFNMEASDSTVTETLTSGTFNMSYLETLSDETETVTWDSQLSTFSTNPTTIADSEPTMDLLDAGSYTATTTGSLYSAESSATISELTTGASSDAFTTSEGETLLPRKRSDASNLNGTVSEDIHWTHNDTTTITLSSRAEERATISDSHVPSEVLHTRGRTVEDMVRTPDTTDAPSDSLSTGEATRTLHTNDTEPDRRTHFYSTSADQFSTVSEVASKAPSSGSESPTNGQLIGIVVGATIAAVILVVIIIVIVVVIYRRKRKKTCYITDHDLKDYRSLMKGRHEPMTLVSPSVAQPISPFSDAFPQDVTSNGPSASNYKMINFDKNSDDGLDGLEIVHDDSREQRSPKEIPIEDYNYSNPSGYSDGSYSVNTFRPPERKNEQKSTDLTQSEAETKFNANESSGKDERAIE